MPARTRKKTDPFATEAAEDSTPSETEETTITVKENSVSVQQEQGSTEFTVTFKAGAGFDAPWIVARVPDLATADNILTNETELLKSVMEKTARAGVFFASQMPSGGSKSSSEGGNTGGGRPARQEAPSGQTRECKHGQMVYRSGSKNGRTWEAFFCPTPQGTADQCKPNFL